MQSHDRDEDDAKQGAPSKANSVSPHVLKCLYLGTVLKVCDDHRTTSTDRTRLSSLEPICSCYSMCMSLEHRLQILLDDERHQRIMKVARERGVSVATVVREAIDRGVSNPDARRKAAGRRVLAAADMPVPDVAALRSELDELHNRHAS
jgi:hypothetical protein